MHLTGSPSNRFRQRWKNTSIVVAAVERKSAPLANSIEPESTTPSFRQSSPDHCVREHKRSIGVTFCSANSAATSAWRPERPLRIATVPVCFGERRPAGAEETLPLGVKV